VATAGFMIDVTWLRAAAYMGNRDSRKA